MNLNFECPFKINGMVFALARWIRWTLGSWRHLQTSLMCCIKGPTCNRGITFFHQVACAMCLSITQSQAIHFVDRLVG